jgi:hypothetical protein
MRFLPTGARFVVILTRQGRVLKEGGPVMRGEQCLRRPDRRHEIDFAPVGNDPTIEPGQMLDSVEQFPRSSGRKPTATEP